MKLVEIDGFGEVEFPDDMDDLAINQAIERDILKKPPAPMPAAPPPPPVPGASVGSALGLLGGAQPAPRPFQPHVPQFGDYPGMPEPMGAREFYKAPHDPQAEALGYEYLANQAQPVQVPPGPYVPPPSMPGDVAGYMQEQPPLKGPDPFLTPESYGRRQAGAPQSLLGAAGDAVTFLAEPLRPWTTFPVKGKSYAQEVGERIQGSRAASSWKKLPEEEKKQVLDRARFKFEKGETLSKFEEDAIMNDASFWDSVQAFGKAFKDSPEASIRELAGEIVAEGPVFAIGTHGVGAFAKMARQGVKAQRSAMRLSAAEQKLHQARLAGKAGAAPVRVLERFSQAAESAAGRERTVEHLTKPGLLKQMGEEAFEEGITEGAIEAAQAEAAGKDQMTPQQAAETVIGATFGAGMGAGKYMGDARMDAGRFGKIRDRLIFPEGIEHNRNIQDQLRQVEAAGDSPRLRKNMIRIEADPDAAVSLRKGEAAPEDYRQFADKDGNLTEDLVEAGRYDETTNRIRSTPYADASTLPEEYIHSGQEALRQEAAAGDRDAKVLQAKIQRWERQTAAERTDLPSGDELFGQAMNVALGHKYGGAVDDLQIPEDLVEEFSNFIGGEKVRKGLSSTNPNPPRERGPRTPPLQEAAPQADGSPAPVEQEAPRVDNQPAEASAPLSREEWRTNPFQLKPHQAKKLPYKTDLPDDETFRAAVANTPGAKVTEDGLLIDLVRHQKPEQDGSRSVRTGVFYLPAGSKDVKHYKGKSGYGGTSRHQGETLLKKPLFAKGATGGKAPAVAYDTLKGKGAYEKMRTDVLKVNASWGRRADEGDVAAVLEKYEGDPDMAYEIIRNSKEGNTLAYAIQEHIVAAAVRKAGYDSVVGYGKKRDGNPFISEVFDVRETTYPAEGMDSDVHEAFETPREKSPRFQMKQLPGGKEETPKNVPTFYSALAKTVETKMGGRSQPGELMKMIKGQGGVRPEELEWTGLEKWLAGKEEGKPVTKAEVLDFLKSQDIEIREKVRGRNGEPVKWESYTVKGGSDYRELELMLPGKYAEKKYGNEPSAELIKFEVHQTPAGKFQVVRRFPDHLSMVSEHPTREIAQAQVDKYNRHGLTTNDKPMRFPGGTHFPEDNVLAFTRFKERTTRDGKKVLFIEELQSDWLQKARDEGFITPTTAEETSVVTNQADAFLDDLAVQLMDVFNREKPAQNKLFKKLFDEHDLARAKAGAALDYRLEEESARSRVLIWGSDNERTPANIVGTKDEASEWIKEQKRPLDSLLKQLPQRIRNYLVSSYNAGEEAPPLDGLNPTDWGHFVKLMDERTDLQGTLRGGAPDAPFKDTWHELALKRLIRLAAEEDYDAIAWSDGATHFERWGGTLMAWNQKPGGKGWDIKYKSQVGGDVNGMDLQAAFEREEARGDARFKQDHLGSAENFRQFRELTNNQLSTHQQKQLWKKIQASPEKGSFVGRKEGYEFFYDKAIPQFMGKFAKKLDPDAKMEKMEVETSTSKGIATRRATTTNAGDGYTVEPREGDQAGYYVYLNGEMGEPWGGPYPDSSDAWQAIYNAEIEHYQDQYSVEEEEIDAEEIRYYLDEREVNGELRYFIMDRESKGQGAESPDLLTGEMRRVPVPREAYTLRGQYEAGARNADLTKYDIENGIPDERHAQQILDDILEDEGIETQVWNVYRAGEQMNDEPFDSEAGAREYADRYADQDARDSADDATIEHDDRQEWVVYDPAGGEVSVHESEQEAEDAAEAQNTRIQDAAQELRALTIEREDGNYVVYDENGAEIRVEGNEADARQALISYIEAHDLLEHPNAEALLPQLFRPRGETATAALPAPVPEKPPLKEPKAFLSIPVTDKIKKVAIGEGFPKYQLKKKQAYKQPVGPQKPIGAGMAIRGYISRSSESAGDASGFLGNLEDKYFKGVDEAYPILKIQKIFEEETGKKAAGYEDIAHAVDRVRGAGGAAKAFINENFAPIYKGGEIGNKKLRPLTSEEQRSLDEFMIAKRVWNLHLSHPDFEDAGLSFNEAHATLQRIEAQADYHTLIKPRAEMVWKYFGKLAEMKLKAGVWTNEEYGDYTKEKFYVPLIRDWAKVFNVKYKGASGLSSGTGSTKAGFTSINRLVRHISKESSPGQPVPVFDPVTAAVMDTHLAAKEIAKMRVWNRVIDLRDQSKVLQSWLEEVTLDYKPEPDEDIVAVRRAGQGEIKRYRVPKELGEAVNDLGYEAMPGIVKAVASVSSVFRRFMVGYNFDFAFANAPRDQQEAFFNGGKIPLRYAWTGAKAFLTKDKIYQDWMKGGGSMEASESGIQSAVESGHDVRYGKGIKNTYKGMEDLPKWKKLLEGAKRTGKVPLDVFASVGEISEMMTRLGVYQHAKKSGLTKEEAVHLSRQATLDFNRIGRQMKSANAMIPFFNAAIQGTDRTFRTLGAGKWLEAAQDKDPKKAKEAARMTTRAAGRIAVSGLLPMAALLAWNQQNENYKDIPAREKEYYWILMLSKTGQAHIKIAKGHVQQLIVNPFQMMIEKMLGTANQGNWKTTANILTSLTPVDDVTSVIPPAVAVPVEQALNKKMYFRSDIVPKPGLDDHLQYDKNTSETAKLIARGLKAVKSNAWTRTVKSPQRLEHLLNGFFGGFSNNALWASDRFLDVLDVGDERDFNPTRAPVIRRVFGITQEFRNDLETELREKRKAFKEAEAAMPTAGRRDTTDVIVSLPDQEKHLEKLAEEMDTAEKALEAIRELQKKMREEVKKK